MPDSPTTDEAAGAPASDATHGAPPAGAIRRNLRISAAIVLVVAVFGLLARRHLVTSGQAEPVAPPPWNMFYRLYALHELPFLLLLVPFAVAIWWLARNDHTGAERPLVIVRRMARAWMKVPAWAAAAMVLLVTAIGTTLVMRRMLLSMDEFATWFQARIFSSGQVAAAIPEQWHGLAPWMTPTFITYKADAQLWISSYLPVYAAMKAALLPAGIDWLLNPLLAVASVVLLFIAARRLWPDRPERVHLAMALLVTSSQFIVMSMSGYTMPAHLCLNLLWLALYLRDDRPGFLLLPVVGVAAMGLHNPFPHALFVTPFLVQLLRQRRRAWLIYMAVIYLAGAWGWLKWLAFSTATTAQAGPAGNAVPGFLGSFRLPGATQRLVQALDLTLVFTWQTPVLAALLVLAIASWRRLGRHERDLAAGLLLTFAFYMFFPVDQGHGWGYRYIYGTLGSVALLGALGASIAAERVGRARVQAVLAASIATTLAVQLPLRLVQAEAFVRPWANARDTIAGRPEPLVAVHFGEGWYTADLVRNDPLFREGPRVIAFHPSWRQVQVPRVPRAVGDSVYLFSRRDMEAAGLTLVRPR